MTFFTHLISLLVITPAMKEILIVMKFRIANLFLLYFPFLLLSLKAAGQTAGNAADSLSLVVAMNTFVDAFSGLNWPVFDACFADDATAFFPPSAKFPYRANGKQEIENIFKIVFENARKRNPGSPHIEIQPREIKIQMLGTTAITSFLLTDPDLLGRRTIVWKKQQDKWLIVHLHASGVPLPQ